MLTRNEKVLLTVFSILLVISVATTVYLNLNTTASKDKMVINRRIHMIDAGGSVEPNFREIRDLKKNYFGNFDIAQINPPINASSISLSDWNNIAIEFNNNYMDYDAFVIVHGHATLTFTASAMAFMLVNLEKPVVFTDGEVANAVMMATTTNFPEVMVVSGGRLMRACKTVALSTTGFSSPNYPEMTGLVCLPPPIEPYHTKLVDPNTRVVVIKVHPGFDASSVASTTKKIGKDGKDIFEPPHGMVIELYNTGQAPVDDTLLGILRELADKGVVMVSVSQSPMIEGRIYEPNQTLISAGVLDGRDMTTPAAYGKLCYLLGNTKDRKMVGKLMDASIRGEMILPETQELDISSEEFVPLR